MLSYSRIFLVIFNIAILLFSLLQFNVAKSMKREAYKKPCLVENAGSITFNAAFLLIISIVGIIGTCFGIKSLQAIYLWIMLILTISSYVYVGFISVLLPRVSAEKIWEMTQGGYWLNEYRPGLQKALISGKDWSTIRNCYVEFRVCDVWRNQPTIQGRNFVEMGCCHPPARCQALKRNTTSLGTRTSRIDANDYECIVWKSSHSEGNCYDCDSCKAGYLAKYQEDWQRGTFLHVVRLVLLTLVTAVTLYAYNDDHKTTLDRFT